MKSETVNLIRIYFKPYPTLSSLENTVTALTKLGVTEFTVLGKLNQLFLEMNKPDLNNAAVLKLYWEKLLGKSTVFGSFTNSALGDIFIAGPLSSTFLGDVNGKTLGTLSVGPYGIMLGMGATETQAKTFIETLQLNHFLILFRGVESKLESYEKILNGLQN